MTRLIRIFKRHSSTWQLSKDYQMPTPRSLGHGMQYRKTDIPSDRKRVAVVVGWMGAKESQLKSYLSFYHAHGFDTLSFAVGPMHVLFPEKAVTHMEKVLDTVINATQLENGTENGDIVYHAFSMGGYLFGLSLECMKMNPERFGLFADRIKGQVFDSPPDKEAIPVGIAKSIGMGPIVEKVAEGITNTYLNATKNTNGVWYTKSSGNFHTNPIPAPALMFYSRADPVARWQDCELVVGKWRNGGKYVEECIWEDTPHIQHGRLYPDKYFGTLHKFLSQKCELIEGHQKPQPLEDVIDSENKAERQIQYQ